MKDWESELLNREVLPCPFCGSRPEIKSPATGLEIVDPRSTTISCEQLFCVKPSAFGVRPDLALASWNTRYTGGSSEAGKSPWVSVHEAWMQFLVDHPTRGGIAESLIFKAGFEAARSVPSAPQITNCVQCPHAVHSGPCADCLCTYYPEIHPSAPQPEMEPKK
jgi:hypothetical protein